MTSDALAGRGADPSSGAGRRLAGSKDSSEFASSLVLRLPASCRDVRWEVTVPPLDAVPRLTDRTAGFFFLRDRANLGSLTTVGER
jgi:hypothetical protein